MNLPNLELEIGMEYTRALCLSNISVRKAVCELLAVLDDKETNEDDKIMTMHTIHDLLFPDTKDEEISSLKAANKTANLEIKLLRKVLKQVQWQNISKSMGGSSYPTCVGCGVQSYGSRCQHGKGCPIEMVLNTPLEMKEED